MPRKNRMKCQEDMGNLPIVVGPKFRIIAPRSGKPGSCGRDWCQQQSSFE